MEKENCVVKNKRYEMVAPDGGWGYMICVASIINYLAISMFYGSFGIIYKDFMTKLHMGTTTVSLLSGMNIMLAAISGYLTSPLLKVLSMRKLALIASFLLNIGALGTVFIDTIALFFVCQGILSFASGILYSASCTLTNDYFVKKRLLATSVIQACSSVGAMVAPQLVKFCLDIVGYQGTLLMISAVYLHTFIAVALMQPASRHMVRIEIETVTDELKLLINDKSASDLPITTPTITLTDTDPPFEEKVIAKGDEVSKSFIGDILDVSMLKKFISSNASMGPTYCMFAEIVFGMMLPQALYGWGFSKSNVARAISLASFGDLITRVVFIFSSKWLSKLGCQEIYIAAAFLAFVSRILMLWSENTTAIMVFITIMGISRCSITVLPPLILAESFGSEHFTKVLGIFMMMMGIMNLVLGPAIGAIRDSTNSYSTAFYVITWCYAMVVLLWIIELLYKRNKHKRIEQREAAERLKKNKSLKRK